MIYRGSCHCGVVSAEYETNESVRLRHDGCSFCRARGEKSASDTARSLRIRSERALLRYRFGHRSTDFLICPDCGAYVATLKIGSNGPVGVANIVGLDIEGLRDQPAALANLDAETANERTARRLARWTPLTLIEPGALT